ncbi:MAG: Holliday junction resolvase RuvX [Longimicrobiales bacterium]|nr:Holliday junction resolvase RuvX [Longimicrobiales bacterium]
MRILGVDYGTRRVGLAVSDTTATLASPLGTLTRRAGRRPPLAAVAEAARTQEAGRIVVGLPLPLSGEEDDWCVEVRRFGAALQERTGLEVVYVDERFTSARAQRGIRDAGLPLTQRRDKGRVDAAAAAVLLQAYLDGAPPR